MAAASSQRYPHCRIAMEISIRRILHGEIQLKPILPIQLLGPVEQAFNHSMFGIVIRPRRAQCLDDDSGHCISQHRCIGGVGVGVEWAAVAPKAKDLARRCTEATTQLWKMDSNAAKQRRPYRSQNAKQKMIAAK